MDGDLAGKGQEAVAVSSDPPLPHVYLKAVQKLRGERMLRGNEKGIQSLWGIPILDQDELHREASP